METPMEIKTTETRHIVLIFCLTSMAFVFVMSAYYFVRDTIIPVGIDWYNNLMMARYQGGSRHAEESVGPIWVQLFCNGAKTVRIGEDANIKTVQDVFKYLRNINILQHSDIKQYTFRYAGEEHFSWEHIRFFIKRTDRAILACCPRKQ